MNGKEFQERYDKLTQAGKIEEARLLLMNWTYYITYKEEIQSQQAERNRKEC